MRWKANNWLGLAAGAALAAACLEPLVLESCREDSDCTASERTCSPEGYCVRFAAPENDAMGSLSPAAAGSPMGEPRPRLQLTEIEQTACTGQPLSLRWEVLQGAARPNSWRVAQGSPGLQIDRGPAESTSWELQVLAHDSGPLSLTVEALVDGQTITNEVTVEVHSTPRIVANQLVSDVCPNELIDLPLEPMATGGRPENYQWTVQTTFPESDATDLGFSLQSGKSVTGRFVSPAPSDPLTANVTLQLHDGRCTAEPRQLPLEQRAQEDEFCPFVRVRRDLAVQPVHDDLPEACLNEPYTVQLQASQFFSQPLEWRQVQAVPGLTLDPVTHWLTGTSTGAGELVVQVTDPTQQPPRVIEQLFPLATRSRCWLAYLTNRGGQRQLELLDGVLRDQPNARRTLEELAAETSVEDFLFSPHGQLLAYRLVNANGPNTLRLLDLRTWQDVPLQEIDGSVTHYAWSVPGPSAVDATTLAVAYTTAEGDGRLGGVNLTTVVSREETLELALAPGQPNYLRPADIRVLSLLHWFGEDRLVLDTAGSLLPLAQLRYATLSSNSELLVDPNFVYPLASTAPAQIHGSPAGFLLATTSGLELFPQSSNAPTRHDPESIFSPVGNWFALARNGNLELFSPQAPSAVLGQAPQFQSTGGCTAVRAWSADGRAIACTNSSSGVERWTLARSRPENEAPLEQPTALAGNFEALIESSSGLQRAFSDDASLFAFRSAEGVHVAATNGSSRYEVRFTHTQPLQASGLNALSFSPDGHWLVAVADNRLDLVGTSTQRAHEQWPSANPPACSETFQPPGSRWCGANGSTPITWSPDSSLLTFPSPEGQLSIVEVDGERQVVPDSRIVLEDSCSNGCPFGKEPRFQPN